MPNLKLLLAFLGTVIGMGLLGFCTLMFLLPIHGDEKAMLMTVLALCGGMFGSVALGTLVGKK